MAPEVFRRDKVMYAVDIWSLGCVIVELMNRSSLFPNLSYCEMVAYLMRWKEEDVILPSFYSKELRRIVQDMLVFDWKTRASAEELLSRPYFHGESFEGKEWTKRYGERSVIHAELQSVIPKAYAKQHGNPNTTKLQVNAKRLIENSNVLLKIVKLLPYDSSVCSIVMVSDDHCLCREVDPCSDIKKWVVTALCLKRIHHRKQREGCCNDDRIPTKKCG